MFEFKYIELELMPCALEQVHVGRLKKQQIKAVWPVWYEVHEILRPPVYIMKQTKNNYTYRMTAHLVSDSYLSSCLSSH